MIDPVSISRRWRPPISPEDPRGPSRRLPQVSPLRRRLPGQGHQASQGTVKNPSRYKRIMAETSQLV